MTDMKKEKAPEQEIATIDEVLEQYGTLRTWHKTICVISALLVLCMIGFVTWGILYEDLRVLLIVFGVIMGVCGVVLFVMMHRIFLKTGAAILDYFRATKMSEDDVLKKAQELKIPVPGKKDQRQR